MSDTEQKKYDQRYEFFKTKQINLMKIRKMRNQT